MRPTNSFELAGRKTSG